MVQTVLPLTINNVYLELHGQVQTRVILGSFYQEVRDITASPLQKKPALNNSFLIFH